MCKRLQNANEREKGDISIMAKTPLKVDLAPPMKAVTFSASRDIHI